MLLNFKLSILIESLWMVFAVALAAPPSMVLCCLHMIIELIIVLRHNKGNLRPNFHSNSFIVVLLTTMVLDFCSALAAVFVPSLAMIQAVFLTVFVVRMFLFVGFVEKYREESSGSIMTMTGDFQNGKIDKTVVPGILGITGVCLVIASFATVAKLGGLTQSVKLISETVQYKSLFTHGTWRQGWADDRYYRSLQGLDVVKVDRFLFTGAIVVVVVPIICVIVWWKSKSDTMRSVAKSFLVCFLALGVTGFALNNATAVNSTLFTKTKQTIPFLMDECTERERERRNQFCVITTYNWDCTVTFENDLVYGSKVFPLIANERYESGLCNVFHCNDVSTRPMSELNNLVLQANKSAFISVFWIEHTPNGCGKDKRNYTVRSTYRSRTADYCADAMWNNVLVAQGGNLLNPSPVDADVAIQWIIAGLGFMVLIYRFIFRIKKAKQTESEEGRVIVNSEGRE